MPLPETSKYSVIFREYDLLVQKLGEILRDARVPENLPKFFIWEGCSMYFSKADSDTYLEELRENMNEQSKLWFDFVATVAVTDDTGYQEVTAFMESMRLIGEPFVNGFESVENDLNRLGFNLTSCCSAADVTRSHDPLQTYYSFVLCTRRL
jgi:O-methyltransferase involved in polyketide biosynthesis